MRARQMLSILVAGVCLLISGSVSAATFPATPRHRELCPVRHVVLNVNYTCAIEFDLPATNGYRVNVSADPGRPNHGGNVALTVAGHSASTIYTAPATVTATGVRASFGRLGRIAVTFHPSGRDRRLRLKKKCDPKRPPVVSSRLGTFRGTIRFHGERGYTEIDAHHAAGGIGDPLTNHPGKRSCELRGSPAQLHRELRAVALQASRPGDGAFFQATRAFGQLAKFHFRRASRPQGKVDLFLASVNEKAGAVSIIRIAAALGPLSDFVFADDLSEATVAPRSPFSGSATIRKEPGGSFSWNGDLSVALPGLASLSLTTPGMTARLGSLESLIEAEAH